MEFGLFNTMETHFTENLINAIRNKNENTGIMSKEGCLIVKLSESKSKTTGTNLRIDYSTMTL